MHSALVRVFLDSRVPRGALVRKDEKLGAQEEHIDEADWLLSTFIVPSEVPRALK